MVICKIRHVCVYVFDKQTLTCTKFVVVETRSVLVSDNDFECNQKPLECDVATEDIVCLR
jgi:hypothetical protein